MALSHFDPPAFLDDFTQEQKDAWSEWISQQIDGAIAGDPVGLEFDAPRAQFFNATKVDFAADMATLDIEWTAFPRNVQISSISDRQRWRRAESSRDLQDEYCEWSVERDPNTEKITRVTFTCEGPEYWQFLAATAPQKVLELYQQFVSPSVQLSDLFLANGRYNPRNNWNNSSTNGVMHLIQTNNSLGAEIELAGGSSVVRSINGQLLTGERELIDCGKYGGRERHSDPRIGSEVNSLTRQKADVTLANPVGLYFSKLITAGWEVPNGEDAQNFWKHVRGTASHPVRAVFEVPSDRGFVVGDIKIDGKVIEFGAQIADKIKIKLTGIAHKFGQSTVAPMTGCRRVRQQTADSSNLVGEKRSVASILGPQSSITLGRR
jgi:hypothetical protein